MPAHAYVPPSELVFEPPVDALHCRALVVAARLRRQLPDAALGQRLALQLRLFVGIPPRVAIDQRHVPQLAAAGPDLLRIVGTTTSSQCLVLAANLNLQGAAIRSNYTGTQVSSATNLLGDIS